MTTPAEHARVWRRAGEEMARLCDDTAHDRDFLRHLTAVGIALHAIAEQYEKLAEEQKT